MSLPSGDSGMLFSVSRTEKPMGGIIGNSTPIR
jgi:hypothetical protein